MDLKLRETPSPYTYIKKVLVWCDRSSTEHVRSPKREGQGKRKQAPALTLVTALISQIQGGTWTRSGKGLSENRKQEKQEHDLSQELWKVTAPRFTVRCMNIVSQSEGYQ